MGGDLEANMTASNTTPVQNKDTGFAETKARKSTAELFASGVVSSGRSSQPALQLRLVGLVKHAQKEKRQGGAGAHGLDTDRCARRKEREEK